MTNDGKNAYLYDGEGRLCAVDANYSVSPSYTQYIYDAGGARVAKGSLTSWPASCGAPGTNGFALTNQYLLDQGGDQVTELNTSNPTGTMAWAHSNVWAGAHLDATYDTNGLHFHLADPLGTRRVQANVYGVIEESFQSLPFGDGLTPVANPNCLTANHCYAEDATEHHFTGKERDAESGNDYFGARYYSSSMGRFMSPDWSAKAEPVPYAKLWNPQSLNLYAYMLNNPLKGTDPDGHDGDPCKGKDNCSYNKDTHVATVMTTSSTSTTKANTDANGNTTSFTTTETKTTTTANLQVAPNGTVTPLDGTKTTTTTATTMTADGNGGFAQAAKVITNSTQSLSGGDVARQDPQAINQVNQSLNPTIMDRAMDHKVGIGGVGIGSGVAIGCALAEPCGAAVTIGGIVVAGGSAIYDMVTH